MRRLTLISTALAVALLAVAIGLAPASAPAAGATDHGGHWFRDAVITQAPSPVAARKLARSSWQRYPVGDSQNRTVAIDIAPICETSCAAKDPQALASFLGSLPHRGEIALLKVIVASKDFGEVGSVCGMTGVLACYFPGRDLMVVPGDDFVSPRDGADRLFVVAHEYGHHLANHRRNPPFVPTVSYGTKRWVTHEHVCQGTRAGRYFPGNGGDHYYENPGEAFAEAFAFARFPDGGVVWFWDQSLKPDATAYSAIRADARRPWLRPTRIVRTGSIGTLRRAVTRRLATPLDGDVVFDLRGEPDGQLDLVVRDARGRVIGASRRWGARERVRLEVCGQRALRVTVRRAAGRPGGDFRLIAWRP